MKWRSLEQFSDDSVAVSALPTAYANSKVRTICSKALSLDQNRQDFTSTIEDMIAKLKAAESSSSINDKLAAYKSQLIRLNDLNNYIISITDFFNGDDVTGQNCIQNLVDLTKMLNTSSTQAYISETSQLLTNAEDTMKTVYTLSNKLETIRNYLINFLNISNRNLSYARLLCLKGQVLDPTLQSLAISVNDKLQNFVAALQNWCAQMANIDPQPTCNNVPAPVPVNAPTPLTQPVSVSTISSSMASSSTNSSSLSTSSTNGVTSTGNQSIATKSCPITQMTYDSGKQEYRITTHPEIKDWVVKNTMWQADGGFVPDYVAQKMGLDNRCEKLDDFKITDHKDIVNYVPNSQYAKLKTAAQLLQSRAKKCEATFQQKSCVCPGKESFQNSSLDDKASDETLVCQGTTQPSVDYQISQHKDFKNLMKKYTPNCKLPSVCKTYPIKDNVAINDYVLKSSLPSSLTVQPLEQHPDFKAYNQSWISKADLQAKTASQNAEKLCSSKLEQYSGKDSCGNPTPCKALADYRLQDHPDFAEYTREWKDVFSKFANKDANGNFVKCQSPESITKKMNNMKADCARSLTALKAKSGTRQTRCPKIDKAIIESSLPKCELEKSELIRNYEKKLNKMSAKQSTALRPDMTRYILRSDVLPCPTKDEIRANIGNYLNSAQMQEMCQKAGFPRIKSDTCESHFVRPSAGSFKEDFEEAPPTKQQQSFDFKNASDYKLDPSHEPIVKPYPQPHDKFSSHYDIMLHRDYKYDDPVNGHMPKQECYATYAMMKDGRPRPCKPAEMDIKQHPDFEKTVMQYGAVRDRCGNLQKPPACPSLKKNDCGDWVQDELTCSDKAKFEAQLFKEKLKFNALLKRYQLLLESKATKTNTDTDMSSVDRLEKQLETMRQSIDHLQATAEQKPVIEKSNVSDDKEQPKTPINKVEKSLKTESPGQETFPKCMATTTHLRRHVDMDTVAPLVDFTSLPNNQEQQLRLDYGMQPKRVASQSEAGWIDLRDRQKQFVR